MSGADALIVGERLSKVHGRGRGGVRALDDVSLAIEAGEVVALRGPSGSGKSTLLNILGCLDRPSGGSYRLGGQDVSRLSRSEQAWIRLNYLGFVFQSFNLIADHTALENVTLPLYYAGVPRRERETRALSLLERVGLGGRRSHRPAELSGGERQRVAIARAVACRPRVLLADEPTGALDTQAGSGVLDLLFELRARERLTLLIVTHDPNVGRLADRQLYMRDGRLGAEDEPVLPQ